MHPAAASSSGGEGENTQPFTLDDLSSLEPDSLTKAQKRCLCNVVACCLPRASPPLPSATGAQPGSEAHLQAQLGLLDDKAGPVPTTFELRLLLLLLQFLSQDPLTLVALQPLLGAGVDPSPFLNELGWRTPAQRMRCIMILLHFSVAALGGYDARMRALLRTLCSPRMLDVPWPAFSAMEARYAVLLAAQAAQAKLEEHAKAKASRSATAKKWLKVGAAGLGAGALLFVTGGLAAPAIGAGIASLGIGGLAGGTAFLASSAGVILVATMFGATGAGLIGYKLNRRISGLSEFRFERISGVRDSSIPLTPGQAKAAATKGKSAVNAGATGGGPLRVVPAGVNDPHASMSVLMCINGWLSASSSSSGGEEDYHSVWQPLLPGRTVCSTMADEDEGEGRRKSRDAPASWTAGQLLSREKGAACSATATPSSPSSTSSGFWLPPELSGTSAFYTPGLAEHSEVYVLRWESAQLLRFGEGLRDISGMDVASSAATVGLQQTVLKGLVMAIAWPVTLLQAGDLIDHPWLIVLDRCAKAAHELANALEARLAGRRPISIVAYSMGARVVFLALEELARRKRARAQQRAFNLDAHARAQASPSPSPSPSPSSSPNPAAVGGGATGEPKSFMDKMKDKLSSSSSKKAGAVVADPNLPHLGEKGKPAAASASKKGKSSPGESGVHVDNPAQEDADGVLLDVFLFGAPVPMDLRRWRLVKSLVSGRLVNGYCRRDWALRYIYPLTSANVRVSGLMPVCDKRTKDELRWREAELARQREARMREQQQRQRDVQLQQVQQQQLYPQQVEMATTTSTASNPADAAAATTSIPPPLSLRHPSVSVPVDALLPPPVSSAASNNAASAAVPLAQPTPKIIEGDEASLHGSSPGGAGGTKGEGAEEEEEEEADADGWEELLSPNNGDDASAAAIDPAEQADELEMLVRPDDVVKSSPEPSAVAPASTADALAGSTMPAGGGGSLGSAATSSASAYSASTSRPPSRARSLRVPPLPCVRWGGIESFDVTALVNGHKDYPRRIELLLRACGYQP